MTDEPREPDAEEPADVDVTDAPNAAPGADADQALTAGNDPTDPLDPENAPDAEPGEVLDAQERESLRRVERGGIPFEAERRLRELGENGGTFTSDLSVADFALCHGLGLQPLAQVMGSSIYQVSSATAQWPRWAGGFMFELNYLSDAWNEVRDRALHRLALEARAVGADAVVGVDLRTGAHDFVENAVEYVVLGTAVRHGAGASAPAGAQPGTQAGAQPGTQAGAQPGTQAGAQPGTQAGAQPGTQAGAQPETQASARLGAKAGAQAPGAQAPGAQAPGAGSGHGAHHGKRHTAGGRARDGARRGPGGEPVLTELSVADYANLRRAGMEPLGVVAWSAAYYVRASYNTQMMGGLGAMTYTNQELPEFTEGVYGAREAVMARMTAQAAQLGATGVIGARINHSAQRFDMNSGGRASTGLMVTFHAIGTAIRETEATTLYAPETTVDLTM